MAGPIGGGCVYWGPQGLPPAGPPPVAFQPPAPSSPSPGPGPTKPGSPLQPGAGPTARPRPAAASGRYFCCHLARHGLVPRKATAPLQPHRRRAERAGFAPKPTRHSPEVRGRGNAATSLPGASGEPRSRSPGQGRRVEIRAPPPPMAAWW